MNSTLQAKLHYDGKPHQKKVSMFLNQSVKKQKTEDGSQVSSTTNNDWQNYCDVRSTIKCFAYAVCACVYVLCRILLIHFAYDPHC